MNKTPLLMRIPGWLFWGIILGAVLVWAGVHLS